MKVVDLTGRICLVVGGGGGGIGTAIVEAAAEAGADVAAITYVEEHARDTEARVASMGRRCATVVADVTDERALVAAIASLRKDLGPIDRLVNVVGGNLTDDWYRTSELDMAAFDRILSRNLRYAVVSCREVAVALIAEGRPGAIVNISSIAAKGTPLLGTYAASKAGLESFSRTMALEWGSKGVRVNLVAPGTIHTPRTGDTAAARELAARTIPLGRRGLPADIADAAMFLLSDLSSYITGQIISIDGGSSLGSSHGDRLPDMVTNPVVRARFGQ